LLGLASNLCPPNLCFTVSGIIGVSHHTQPYEMDLKIEVFMELPGV
jgi:hypothetical protein